MPTGTCALPLVLEVGVQLVVRDRRGVLLRRLLERRGLALEDDLAELLLEPIGILLGEVLLGANRDHREQGDERQSCGCFVHTPDCSKAQGWMLRLRAAPSLARMRRSSLRRSIVSSKIRNRACCRASRTSSTAS